MTQVLVNIDVPDLEQGERFYTEALGLRVGRRMGPDFLELLGAGTPIYLLLKQPGTPPFSDATVRRDYGKHWTPVHMDFVVDDIDGAVARAEAAGATREGPVSDHAYGRLALLRDPFGNGWCLLQFNERGYDAIETG
ncbi:MAG TPA: VOC family protein [Polyangiaceae bacterium]|nr:VOC family protein [Polyangiaceae bacterium]